MCKVAYLKNNLSSYLKNLKKATRNLSNIVGPGIQIWIRDLPNENQACINCDGLCWRLLAENLLILIGQAE
jgi:hypothetical protein